MNLIPKFTETSLSEKKIIYNYTTENGTYNATDNKIDLVVSPNNNFFVLENEDMQSFSAKNIYFTKVIHYTDTQDDLVGQVIVEHTNNTFTVFPLMIGNNVTSNTELDYILSGTSYNDYKDVTLNYGIRQQTNCYHYNDESSSIYVFNTPIEINTSPSLTTDSSGLSKYVENNSQINYNLIQQRNISKQSSDDIYMDCSPTGASQEELDTYEVPINSRMKEELGVKRSEEMVTYFFFFMCLVAFSYFVSPPLYHEVVTKYVLKKTLNTPPESDNGIKLTDCHKHVYRKALDILYIALIMITLAGLMSWNIMIGIVFAVFVLLSVAFIRDRSKVMDHQILEHPMNSITPQKMGDCKLDNIPIVILSPFLFDLFQGKDVEAFTYNNPINAAIRKL